MAFTRQPSGGASLLERAMKTVGDAVDHDKNGRYQQALDRYMEALECFEVVLRHERSDRMRARIRAKVNDYLERAEVLKTHLQENSGGSGSSNNRSSNSGGVGTKKDACMTADSGSSSDYPSMRVVERPTTRWSDIVGAEEAKQTLFEAVAFPLRFPSIFTDGDASSDISALRPWRGILLYGPPGTGKTMLARAAAANADAAFFSASAATIMAKYVGESERAVRRLFEEARAAAPSIVFIDEVDSLLVERSDDTSESAGRVKTEFFTQMDGLGSSTTQSNNEGGHGRVLVLGTTNRPWSLDGAAMRRFERRVYVPLPDEPSRRQLFESRLATVEHRLTPTDLRRLATLTEGYSGADVDIVARRATMSLIREAATSFCFVRGEDGNYRVAEGVDEPGAENLSLTDLPDDSLRLRALRSADLERAIAETPSSVRADDVRRCQEFTRE